MRWGAALAVAVVAGCFHPSAETGAPCSPDGTCPSGQTCDEAQVPPTCVGGTDAAAGSGSADARIDARESFLDAPPLCGGSACPASAPICDADANACRGCALDTECASDACNELDGTCWAEDAVVYVATGGDDSTNGCTRVHPCALLSTGIAHRGTRLVFAIAPGTYLDSGVLDGITGADVVVSGGTGDYRDTVISFQAVAGQNHTLEISNGTNATLSGITFAGGNNDVMRVDGGADVNAFGCMFTGGTNGANGIDILASGVHLFGVTVADNAGAGVHAQSGDVDLDGCYIDDNQKEGIATQSASYVVVNTVLWHNHRGAFVSSTATAPATAVFAFDTVVDNDGDGNPGFKSNTAVTVSSSIFVGNGTTPIGGSGALVVEYSLFDGVGYAGLGNLLNANPSFTDATNGDFRINADSAAIDAADPNATLDHDYDDDQRPHGGRADIGADEQY